LRVQNIKSRNRSRRNWGAAEKETFGSFKFLSLSVRVYNPLTVTIVSVISRRKTNNNNKKRRNERRRLVQRQREKWRPLPLHLRVPSAFPFRQPPIAFSYTRAPQTHAGPIRDYIIIIIFSVPHLPPFSSLEFFVSYVFRVPSSLPPVFSRTESVGCGPAPGASYQSYLSVRTI